MDHARKCSPNGWPFIFVALVGAVSLVPAQSCAATKAPALTCTEVEGRLRDAAGLFADVLPVPAFRDDQGLPGGRTTRSVAAVEVYLGCDKGEFKTYEASMMGGNTATLLRWTLWTQASLIATNNSLGKEQSFRFIQRLQKATIAESIREEIGSGDKSGCARLKSGSFEFEYSVQPGQISIAFRPSYDEKESCKLLR